MKRKSPLTVTLRDIANLRDNKFDHTTHPGIPEGGFLCFVDVLGSDKALADAARLTAGKLDFAERNKGKPRNPDDDVKLIRHLMRHMHTSPMEFGEIVVKIRVPMDTWRQMVRHRTFNVNEYSTRYSPAIDDTSEVQVGEWRQQASSNRQGSSGVLSSWSDKLITEFTDYLQYDRTDGGAVLELQEPELLSSILIARLRHNLTINPRQLNKQLSKEEGSEKEHPLRGFDFYGSPFVNVGDAQIVYSLWLSFLELKGLPIVSNAPVDYSLVQECLTALELTHHKQSRSCYNFLLENNVAREQARRDLPLSTFTEVVWKADVHNIFHFLKLRLAPEAQLEVRAYAQAFAEVVKTLFPVAYAAFEDYRLHAVSLSRMEFNNLLEVMTKLLSQNKVAVEAAKTTAGGNPNEYLHQMLVPESNEISGRELNEYIDKFVPLLSRLGIS